MYLLKLIEVFDELSLIDRGTCPIRPKEREHFPVPGSKITENDKGDSRLIVTCSRSRCLTCLSTI